MEKIKVLITSAGRRVRLVENFKKHSAVYTCDMNPVLSAACQISDKYFKAPPVKSKEYIPFLTEICKKEKIDILVPTIDTELSVLAENRHRFENTLVVVSEKDLVDTFYLKTSTFEFFTKHGFKTPRIVKDLKNASYPLFAKLNNSSLSVGAGKVESFKEAQLLKEKNPNYVFQEFIKGDEYTVDVFINKKGDVVSVVPRKRIEVRCGEVSKAKTCKDRAIINEVKRLCGCLKGAYGVLTIQLFKRDNDIIFIEINPRFGGGYPLSYISGADYAKFLIDDYLDKELKYFEGWKDNLIMLRYDAEVIVDGDSV